MKNNILMSYDDYTDYTSELCHMLKRMGDIDFSKHILDYIDIDKLIMSGRKKHALYTVAMMDCVSKENHIPVNENLNKYRNMKMETLCFSSGVELYTKITKKTDMKERVLKTAMPEFLVYNIVESSIRNIS